MIFLMPKHPGFKLKQIKILKNPFEKSERVLCRIGLKAPNGAFLLRFPEWGPFAGCNPDLL